jgi:dolichol-phosphate mannosyltransferase
MSKKTIIVIPAYNEEQTIGQLIERCKKKADICVVNDGSKDKTFEIVNSYPDVIQITHKENAHIPQTIKDGMMYAYVNDYDYVITMDAGLSHLPEELSYFIDYPDCDLLVGYRTQKVNVPWYRQLLSIIGTLSINMVIRPPFSKLTHQWFKDITSGYRRYSIKAIEILLNRKMMSRTFDFHSEAFMLIYRNGLSIKEIPITYVFTNSSLRFKVILDSIRMLFNMFISRRK